MKLCSVLWCKWSDAPSKTVRYLEGNSSVFVSRGVLITLDPINLKSTFQVAHFDCPWYRRGRRPEESVFRCCIYCKLLVCCQASFFLHCSWCSLWLKCFFLISYLICKHAGLGFAHCIKMWNSTSSSAHPSDGKGIELNRLACFS